MWFNFFKEIILWLADLDARLLLIVNGAHQDADGTLRDE